jgi:hypothetical protein
MTHPSSPVSNSKFIIPVNNQDDASESAGAREFRDSEVPAKHHEPTGEDDLRID